MTIAYTSIPVQGGSVITTPIGQQAMAGSITTCISTDQSPIPTTGSGAQITFTPTVTATTYPVGYSVGGVMHFVNILPANFTAVINSICVTFAASTQTAPLFLSIFPATPTGTYTDHTAPVNNAADMASMGKGGTFLLATPQTPFGDTIYNLDGIGHFIVGTSRDLWAVLSVPSVGNSITLAALASITDVQVSLGALW